MQTPIGTQFSTSAEGKKGKARRITLNQFNAQLCHNKAHTPMIHSLVRGYKNNDIIITEVTKQSEAGCDDSFSPLDVKVCFS